MSSLSSLQWAFLSTLPRSFGSVVINWATCSDPTFLGDHDPKCGEVATYNSWKYLRMLPLVYLISIQSPPPTWPVNTLLTALPSCCLHFYLFIIKIFRITFTPLTLLSHHLQLSIKFNILSWNKIKYDNIFFTKLGHVTETFLPLAKLLILLIFPCLMVIRFPYSSPMISSPYGTKRAPAHLSNGEAPLGRAAPTSAWEYTGLVT